MMMLDIGCETLDVRHNESPANQNQILQRMQYLQLKCWCLNIDHCLLILADDICQAVMSFLSLVVFRLDSHSRRCA